jgi:hypothetical protein
MAKTQIVFNHRVIGQPFQSAEVTLEGIRPSSSSPMDVRLEKMLA